MDWQELLQELIQLVENAAPVLWAIFKKQVYVNALQQVIGGNIAGSVAFVTYRGGRTNWNLYKESDGENSYDVMAFLLYLITGIAAVLSIALILSSISRVINPEFYAIEMLINYVR